MASCQLCGGAVRVDANIAVCTVCGTEYDVIRHRRRGDFSRSPEVAIGAKQYPTTAHIYLGPWPFGLNPQYPPGTILHVGQTIGIRVGLRSPDEGNKWITSQALAAVIYHKIDTGPWEEITRTSWNVEGTVDIPYTLAKAGTHTFYMDWAGTAVYAGCESTVDGLEVFSGHYSRSPEVSLEAAPALTVIVKDMILKKPIEGAKVVVDTVEALTDAAGMVVFEVLEPGTYTVSVSARDYKSESRIVELTAAGMVVEVHPIHVGAIALGIVGVASVGVVAVHYGLKRVK